MSQSPLKPVYVDEAAIDYTQGWGKISDFLKQGRSWSGNERNCAYLNTGSGRFANVSAVSGLDFPDDGRNIALFDLDHDGDLDLWLANRSGPQLRLMRNDTGDGHFLAVRLEGVTCNRDAIGARVTVFSSDRPERPLVRTLRAGESYKSQSTKWLHFGLGASEEIAELTVRWPDGKTQTFKGLAADKHYLIKQGQLEPRVWQRPGSPPKLKAATLSRPAATEEARVVFAARMPMPLITWADTQKQPRRITDYADKPLLLNLWASWCAPCVGELKGFTAKAQAINDAGLSVVAVSVDGLDEAHETTGADALRLLDQIGFPFERGFANEAMLDKLQYFHNRLYGLNVKMPVPTSLLIDKQGRLAAVYRGPVEVDQILSDMSLLDEPWATRRDRAAPFAGRWHSEPPHADLSGLAGMFLEHGYLRDAVRYMSLLHRAKSPYVTNNYTQTMTNIGAALMGLNKSAEAVAIYQQAIASNPTNVKARTNLALLLQSQGQRQQAAALLVEALKINPNDALVHQRLGSVLLEMNQLPEGAQSLQRALAIDQSMDTAHNDLGIVRAQAGDFERAASSFAKASQLKPQRFEYRFNHCRALMDLGRQGEALDELTKTVTADTQVWQLYYPAIAGLVMKVASNPASGKSDISKAVEFAKLGVQAVAAPVMLDALGAAYAAAGNYDQAIIETNRALAVEGAQQMSPTQSESIKVRLQLYQQGKPFQPKR